MDDKQNPLRPSTPVTPGSSPPPNQFSTRPQPNPPTRPLGAQQASQPIPQPSNSDAADISQGIAEQTMTPTSPSKPKKNTRLLIGLILTALAILGLGLTYVFWYQNPNKVVSDALINAINAKSLTYTGTATTAGTTKTDITFGGGGSADGGTLNAKLVFDTQAKKYSLAGDAVVNKSGDLYFKVKDIDDLVNNYRSAIPANSQKLFDQIIAKVNDKWIKISSDDLKNYNADIAKVQKCTAEAMQKIQDDKAVKSELTAVYKKHPFIAIDKSLGSKDGSLGYTLSASADTSKAFAKEYKNTSLYKTLVACDSSFTIKDDDLFKDTKTSSETTKVDVWVDQWTHRISKVTLNDNTKSGASDVAIEPKFNQPVTVATPKDATTLEQLQKDVQALLQTAAPATKP